MILQDIFETVSYDSKFDFGTLFSGNTDVLVFDFMCQPKHEKHKRQFPSNTIESTVHVNP